MAIQDTLRAATNPFASKTTPQKPYAPPRPSTVVKTSPPRAATNQGRESQVLGATTTAGGASSGPSDADRATATFYGSQIDRLNNLLGGLGTTEEQGLARIGDEAKLATGRANEDQSRVLRDLGVRREDTEKDKTKSLGNVDESVSKTSEGLQRSFRLGGAGISGAAQIFAPRAVSKVGAQQRSSILDRFGRNMRGFDMAEDDADTQYERSVADIERQRKSQATAFRSGVQEQKLSILDRLAEAAYNQQAALGGDANAVRNAMAPYTERVDTIIDRLGQLAEQGRQPVYNVAPIDVTLPELEDYTTDPLTESLQRSGGAAGTGEEYLPYLPFMRRLQGLAA